MLTTTTNQLEGYHIDHYYGVVAGEYILGANFLRDITANLRDFFGGRNKTNEVIIAKAREEAITKMQEAAEKLGANAILGMQVDVEFMGPNGSMMMVNAIGTAVKATPDNILAFHAADESRTDQAKLAA